LSDLKILQKNLGKSKNAYYEVNDKIKKTERDLVDVERETNQTEPAIKEKITKCRQRLDKLEYRKQSAQIAYVTQVVVCW
jgi:septal ring factor EnvC (AmiA/AmiB activator)